MTPSSMSQQLIALNPDLARLNSEGFNVEIRGAYLVVRDIPYVTSNKEIRRGILVTTLELAGDKTIRPTDHTIKFAGDYPCRANGSPIEAIRHQSLVVQLAEDLVIHHSFSAKPPIGYYIDYYEKITTYAGLLSGQAALIDPNINSWTARIISPDNDKSPFNYLDTASARAEINLVTQKLSMDKVAIVGVGGTGSYVLDFLAKTPVKEIHLFDGDIFSTHNAFRAPGAPSIEELREQPLKTTYFKNLYSKMHRGIITHDAHVDSSNIDKLRNMTFVFLCMDSGPAKIFILQKLEEFGVVFIDVGMGLYLREGALGGILRVTTSTPDHRDAARKRIPATGDNENNEYDKNIQIADLNALNAILAILKWKKLCGFYLDQEGERFTSYTIGCNMLLSEDLT